MCNYDYKHPLMGEWEFGYFHAKIVAIDEERWIRWPSNANQRASPNDPLKVTIRPITSSKTKRIQEELIGMILKFRLTSCNSARLNLLCNILAISEATSEILLEF